MPNYVAHFRIPQSNDVMARVRVPQFLGVSVDVCVCVRFCFLVRFVVALWNGPSCFYWAQQQRERRHCARVCRLQPSAEQVGKEIREAIMCMCQERMSERIGAQQATREHIS